jgi:flagellar hook-associated protein 1 FlgK
MASLSGIMDIAKRSLMAQQAAIDVTGHNVANAGTTGYSRQRIDLQATAPIQESFGYLGTGVAPVSIQRAREAFVDQQIRSTNASSGEATQEQRIVSQVEAALNEPTDGGLGSIMTKFFGSFQELALHPEDTASRNAVVQNATLMNDSFHRLSGSMEQLKSDLSLDAQARVEKINSLLKDISDVEQRITSLEANGLSANDAKDLRDNKIDELSKLANVRVSEDSQGGTAISLGGVLVESRAGFVPLKLDSTGGTLAIRTQGSGLSVDVSSGELGGILNTNNVQIPGFQGKLDSLASTIIARVNTIHATGYGLGTPPPTGNDFFSGNDARTIDVSPTIKASVNAMAASSDGAPGNNATALALGAVPTEMLMNGGVVTTAQYYNGLVSDVGATIQSSNNAANSQDLVLKQLENQRSSISGVSIDEEMVNLIKFQRGFDAAAKIINTVNEMYQSIINMV